MKKQCENCELKVLLECVNYSLEQVRNSSAQVLKDTTGKGYDSMAYIEHQLLSLHNAKKHLEEAIDECENMDSVLQALDQVFTAMFNSGGKTTKQ